MFSKSVLMTVSPVVPCLHRAMKARAPTKFLPLADILHDLAVLRAAEAEKPGANDGTQTDPPAPVAASVASAYEYTRAARTIIRLHASNQVEREGARIDGLRSQLGDLLEELDAGMASN